MWKGIPGALVVGLLLAGPSPGFGSVEVGGSGALGPSFWAQETGGGCGSTRINRRDKYTETLRGEAHVTVEPEAAPGLEIGGAGGVYWTAALDRSITFVLDDDSGVWETASQSIDYTTATRGWGGVVLGVHQRHIKSRLVFGLGAGTTRDTTPELLPVADLEVAVGRLGVAAYQFGWEFFPSGSEVLATEMSIFHGARILGGDWPTFLIGADIGIVDNDGAVPKFTMGFESPRHWRVRPMVRVALTPPPSRRDPTTPNWRLDFGVDVTLGRPRPRHSELVGDGRGPARGMEIDYD